MLQRSWIFVLATMDFTLTMIDFMLTNLVDFKRSAPGRWPRRVAGLFEIYNSNNSNNSIYNCRLKSIILTIIIYISSYRFWVRVFTELVLHVFTEFVLGGARRLFVGMRLLAIKSVQLGQGKPVRTKNRNFGKYKCNCHASA